MRQKLVSKPPKTLNKRVLHPPVEPAHNLMAFCQQAHGQPERLPSVFSEKMGQCLPRNLDFAPDLLPPLFSDSKLKGREPGKEGQRREGDTGGRRQDTPPLRGGPNNKIILYD